MIKIVIGELNMGKQIDNLIVNEIKNAFPNNNNFLFHIIV